ncbi:uncharacterized protein PV09_03636 [Verruconis gallopava]|uniref:Tetrapyrrole biosynthesis uroporphyrinogen III synthase domain-containing protein n=1 Tax=Verruconis gallopava TaxID=253628 RepID=A0A0D1XSS0_9PEZI|nr:uncharacterized protein PV09_03636 [Verruconis gallopava]KIW05781.1 hypothetical protein PV09_03636 [Verruconis gallopava]
MAQQIPVLLLKTKSSPSDSYEERLRALDNGRFSPEFAPVLEHRFRRQSLQEIADVYKKGDLGLSPKHDGSSPKYGGIIFTSQRAVEAFSQVINTLRLYGATNALLPNDVPFYVVGPATSRALAALQLDNAIVGEETGNGEALASFILQHYNALLQKQNSLPVKPALLFLVGEQRRDVVPKTLQSERIDPALRIAVDEIVVYETTEMKSFKSDFAEKYLKGVVDGCTYQWVVVFSPTGCKAMFEALGLLDQNTGKYKDKIKRPFIATIGPTTRDYLVREFSFEPDVCAEQPSPEGVCAGISAYMAKLMAPVADGMDVDSVSLRKRQRTD